MEDFKNKSEEEWKQLLTQEQYNILREKRTESAFSGEYNDNKEEGIYVCRGCSAELFSSDTKFDSKTGWPSFYEPVSEGVIEEEEDNSLAVKRTEVLCSHCGGHLGHRFDDGPEPTGKRYCINSTSLEFKGE